MPRVLARFLPRAISCPVVAFIAAAAASPGSVSARSVSDDPVEGTSVSIVGVLDAAIRHTSNEQDPTGSPRAKTQMIGGGMSQSRIGLLMSQDLGGSNQVLANLEHRLMLDAGTAAGNEFWQQSWVGLKTAYGRWTLGRQYNVLFDVSASSYASFPYSPFIEAYKPELGFSLGSRTNNMVKFAVERGPLVVELQASPGEGAALGGKTLGGMVRYAFGELVAGGAWLELADGAGRKATASTIGASWSSGPWVLTANAARNRFEPGYNPLLILAYLTSSTTNGLIGPNMDHRDGYSLGATWQATPQLNLGGHYWRVTQQGVTAAGTGSAVFKAFVADYALSRQTDAYVEFDHTPFAGAITFPNGATSRTGFMVGLRQRF